MVTPDKLPSLASIRAFECAARLGGFAQAAAELGTTAASVSYHVRQLERQLGMPLFHRHAQRVELTQGGSVIAREAMDAFAALRASFVRAVEVDESRLALTTLPSFGASWLTPRLGGFRAAHPQIALRIDISGDAEDLNDGRFDAAIRNGNGRWPGMQAVKLFPSIFMPLCAPGLKNAAAALASPKRALEVPLLGRPDWWTMWFRARGFNAGPSRDKFGTSLAHEYLDIAAAMAGQGIAIGSPLLFRAELEAGRLVPAHDLVATDHRAFWFIYPAARQHSRKIAAFGQWIDSEAAAARAAGAGFLRRIRS
jgi:LysR family glycine cleavage system transcriptional activator